MINNVLDFDKFMRAMREPLTLEARETIAGIPIVVNEKLPDGVAILAAPYPFKPDGTLDESKVVVIKFNNEGE